MRFDSLKYFLLLAALLLPTSLLAEEPKAPKGPPPMLVEVAEIGQGAAEPVVELVGTVRFGRVSRVAAEVSGIVKKISITEGARVKKGHPLVQLSTDLLDARLAGTRANYEQAQVELERARKDLQRIDALFAEKSVSESLFDENFYRVQGLEKQVAALKASLDHQQLEIKKTTIYAPFDGLVQEQLTEQGEWVSTGGQVAIIADDRQIEVDVDVPQHLLGYLQSGQEIPVRSGGQNFTGRFVHFIPQGDIATRTFTVKLKLDNAQGLIEGMEAHASLPSGPKLDSLLVPRDAVIKQFGQQVIFLAVEGKAQMVPVQIKGYQGMQVAVEAPDLKVGQQVVIKGNERIRDGQPVRF